MERLNDESLADRNAAAMVDSAIATARLAASKPIPVSEHCLHCGTMTGGRRWCDVNCLKEWQEEKSYGVSSTSNAHIKFV